MITRQSNAGFTLVEVAMALLVAGLGVIAVFGLVSHVVGGSRRAVDATEVSLFADYVLDGLQVESTSFVWEAFGNSSVETVTNAAVPKTHALMAVGTTQYVAAAFGQSSSDWSPRLFEWVPGYFGEAEGLKLGFATQGVYQTRYDVAQFTYTLDVDDRGETVKYARLEVWPGDRVAAVKDAILNGGRVDGSTVFYREYVPLQ